MKPFPSEFQYEGQVGDLPYAVQYVESDDNDWLAVVYLMFPASSAFYNNWSPVREIAERAGDVKFYTVGSFDNRNWFYVSFHFSPSKPEDLIAYIEVVADQLVEHTMEVLAGAT